MGLIRGRGVGSRSLVVACAAAVTLCVPAAASAATVVSAITAGIGQTCALTSSAGLQCWGYNRDGELGDGTTTSRAVPVAVSGLSGGVSAASARATHTCALRTVGGVECWGANGDGQLGDGTTTSSSTPVAVAGLSSGVETIAAGDDHTCVVTSAGGVKCWGANGDGQLGDGTTTGSAAPVQVSGLHNGVSAITAGSSHTCALTDVGAVKCWGLGSGGQLGDGTTTSSSIPVAVTGLSSGVKTITAGLGFTCAVTSAGAVKCWGDNVAGQLGDGTTGDSSVPVSVSGLTSGVSAIAAGEDHTCAVTNGGSAECWGFNGVGQLGDATTLNSSVPVPVSGLTSGVSAITAGDDHTCALTRAGGVKCWGYNADGELGTGTNLGPQQCTLASGPLACSTTPVQVSGLPGVWALRVSGAGAGAGIVTSSPAGIGCGGSGYTACSALFAAGSAVTLSATPVPGATFAGWSGGGCSGAGTCTVTLTSDTTITATFNASAPPGSSAPSVTPSPPPRFAHVFETVRRWREGTLLSRGSRKHRGPVGTRFGFTLNESAHVVLSFARELPGRRTGRRCVAPNRHNRSWRRCSRTVTAGVLVVAGRAGANTIRFAGRISRGRKLAPGTYTVAIIATDTAGRRTTTKLTFTIVKG